VPDREAGLRFLEWLQEELLALPTIMEGFMSFASLVTCEGAMNALSACPARGAITMRASTGPMKTLGAKFLRSKTLW
jgi:hypothetical protein